MNNTPLYGYHILYIHSSVNGRLGYFRSLAIVNNDAMLWTVVYKFLCEYDFISLGYIPKSEIAGSYRNSIFNLLRPVCFFLSSSTILNSHQQWMSVLISLHSSQHMLF